MALPSAADVCCLQHLSEVQVAYPTDDLLSEAVIAMSPTFARSALHLTSAAGDTGADWFCVPTLCGCLSLRVKVRKYDYHTTTSRIFQQRSCEFVIDARIRK